MRVWWKSFATVAIIVACMAGCTSPAMMRDASTWDVTSVDREPPPRQDARVTDTSNCVDIDNDGHLSAICGGDDCDDSDPTRSPSGREVCDSAGNDEDCNPCTVAEITASRIGGDGDRDEDGFPATRCFNRLAGGATAPTCASAMTLDAGVGDADAAAVQRVAVTATEVRGTDCADDPAEQGATRFPGATEICNMLDDDCDSIRDEGVTSTRCYVDLDRDGFANAAASMMTLDVCAACPTGFTATPPVGSNVDCDDADAARFPGNAESCDGRDNDCVSATADGADDRRVGRACTASAALGPCRSGVDACVGGTIACQPSAGRQELCNGIDDDCDGELDEGLCVDSHSAPTGYGTCRAAGVCEVAICRDGRGNCDGDPRNGCETPLASDASNCGACGVHCVSGTCAGGLCTDSMFLGISTGGDHACTRTGAGRVICWGANSYGQLGDGSTVDRPTSVQVASLTNAVEVSAGRDHTCARRSTGDVVCWGRNNHGQLGDGSTVDRPTATVVPGLTNVNLISAGGDQTCAIRNRVEVVCWGSGRTAPYAVIALADIYELDVGAAHACVRRSSGQVLCWGSNRFGQLGDGTTIDRAVPAAVAGLTDAESLSTHENHTCARRASSTQLLCWGANESGQLGDGTSTNRLVPVAVAGFSASWLVSAGRAHTCASNSDGGIYCWGANGNGELGDGTTTPRLAPVAVLGASGALQLSAGGHTCIQRSNRHILCWGANGRGQLGDGTTVDRGRAGPIRGLEDAVEIAAGGRHTCARRAYGRLLCWGDNFDGQAGPVAPGSPSNAASELYEPVDVVEVSAGYEHTCARRAVGQIDCWGDNEFGQLGRGHTRSERWVLPVPGVADAVEVRAGFKFTCARRASGRLLCWGTGAFGQLGDGRSIDCADPVEVATVTDAVEVRVGGTHACARLSGGEVVCWGRNNRGQLGDGTTIDRATPVRVAALNDVIELNLGASHSCARRVNGQVFCWGNSSNGQLGVGARTDQLRPVFVPALSDAAELGLGPVYSCARQNPGRISCWGSNSAGQLGDGTTTERLTPVSVVGITDSVEVAVGGLHACARLVSGRVVCWGDNGYGQLADGTTLSRSMPTPVIGL
ncbi:MAG: hypothetical protein JNK05_36280 [Myxococcales bacterium]|nr:hypothetical protein [Myxococcales bacterium]